MLIFLVVLMVAWLWSRSATSHGPMTKHPWLLLRTPLRAHRKLFDGSRDVWMEGKFTWTFRLFPLLMPGYRQLVRYRGFHLRDLLYYSTWESTQEVTETAI